MEYYAIYLPYKEPDVSIKSFYTDKEEALKMLKTHKEARLKAFRTSEEAVYFYLNGPTEPTTTTTASSSLVMGTTSDKASLTTGNGNNLLGGQMPKSPTTGQLPLPSASAKLKLEKTPFKAPKSQELVAFRKNIEKNELDLVRNIIELNPRYLVSSGDMPTILKEGPRYNALHVAAMEGNTDMCRLILATIENPAFIEFLHGQRNASTDEVSAILLDLYLNMPDKCRSETPLHFAAKFGSVGVIEVLISYPQCKLTKNSDGHLPKDIICARAKPRNDTPEIRRAIADLLRERFYVPVLRAVDRSTPPVIGEPFTLANPPNLEPARGGGGGAGDRFSPQLEIKAYAGPMDREQAQVFCRRWKTPPRLIPSPRAAAAGGFVSPVRGVSSSSKIPVAASTPIATKGAPAGGRRTLFPNKSFELALEGEREKEKEKEEERNNSINNNFEIEVVREEEEEALEEEALEEDVKNGNSVVRAVKSSVASSFLFRKYREPPLQNSFATIYDDDDEEDEFRKDLVIPVPVTPVKDSPQVNGNGSFSYFCDGNNSFYEGTNITESPSFKERRLRLTDTEKGLEIIGRNLAEDHAVGWNEYWAFLGTFADLRNNEGLAKLEEFLKKRREKVELDEQEEALKNVRKEQLPSTGPNDSLGSICDALDQMRLHTGATPQLPNFRKRSTPLTSLPAVPLFPSDPPPQEPPQIRSNITNPYLCLHRSLQVFAKRFVKNLDDACSSTMTVDFNAFFQQAVVDCVRKLNTLVGNYRRDAAFTTIDFSRVHSRYAQLIVLHIESTPETAPKIIHRLKLLLDRSRDVNAAHRHPDLAESLACLQNLLDLYILKSAELTGSGDDPETEASCSAAWREHPLVRGCRCRIESAGGYAKKGSMERLVKRREQRRKVTAAVPMQTSSSFSLYRDPAGQDVRKVSTPVAVAKAVAGRTWSDEEDDDEDEEYFSCSDSELDTDSDVEDDDPNVSYVTPPSSPSSFLLQSPLADSQLQQESNNSSSGTSRVSTDDGVASGGGDDEDDQDQFLDTIGDDDDEDDGVEREPEFRNYIEGAAPTKQDVDVLNVVEKRPVDAAEFPHVHEWRQAMLRMSPEERERIATQKKPRDLSRSNWRGAANDTSMNLADLSANQSSFLLLDQLPPSSPKSSQLTTTTPPSSPIRSVSAAAGMFRFGRARELAANTAANDSLGSLDGRLGLMNISDCGSGVDTPKEGHRHRHQLIQQQRIAPAPSS